MKKLVSLLLSLLLLASIASASAEPVKIRYYNLWPKDESSLSATLYYQLYDEFRQAYPDIELEIIADSHEAWATKVKTMMVANDLTEVFISQPSDFSVYADSGVYYDFTDDLEADPEWKESFLPGSLDILAKDGRVYGIPHSGYVEGVFYNQQLFDQFGLTYPNTFEELLECVKVFNENGIATFSVGAKDGWPITMYTQFLMDREMGYDYFERACSDAEATLEMPEYVEAFNKFLQLVEAGAFSESAAGASADDAITAFLQGKVAMMVNGDWACANILAVEDQEFIDNVHFANFPTIDGGKGVQSASCVGFGKSFCISNSATDEEKVAALTFVKFMNNSEVSARFLETASTVTANRPVGADESKLSPLYLEITGISSAAEQTWAAYGEFITPGFYDEMNKIGQQLLMNSISAEDAASSMEKARLEFQIDQ